MILWKFYYLIQRTYALLLNTILLIKHLNFICMSVDNASIIRIVDLKNSGAHLSRFFFTKRTTGTNLALSFWLCSSGTFRRWFGIMKRTERNAYENDVRSYPPIEDDLCRSHGRCTRDALLSRASATLPPRSRIDRYYFRPVHDTRWIHNALPRARRNVPAIIMPICFVRRLRTCLMRLPIFANRVLEIKDC